MIKLIKYCYILIILAAFISINPVKASAGTSPIPDDPAVLCLPGIYLINPGNCNPDGPSSYLTRMAQEGITLPLKGLPASKPDKALTQVDLHYGIVRTKSAPVYSSVEDALNAAKRNAVRHIEAPFSYISYTDEVMVDGKRFYQIEPGSWMTANDISRIGSFSQFQGVTFSRTPDNGFGWVLSYLSATPVESKQTPGYAKSDYTGHVFQPLELVQIYETKKVNDADWVMIAPDEWLPKRVVAGVTPNTYSAGRGHRRSLDRSQPLPADDLCLRPPPACVCHDHGQRSGAAVDKAGRISNLREISISYDARRV